MSSTRRWLVSGKVQGVGFRYFARREADFLGLTGSVRNLEDGRVEVIACGAPEVLDRFAEKLADGPSAGRVDAVADAVADASDLAPEASRSTEFRILF